MTLFETIVSVFEEVAADQQRSLTPITPGLKIAECGLDSLSFALIVARLEDALGFDPFDTDDDVKFPVTFGEFVRLYEKKA